MEEIIVAANNLNFASRTDLVIGPQKIRCKDYGVSLTLPAGWLAGLITNEVYGIESLSPLKGRICVVGRTYNFRELMLSHDKSLDVGYIKLHVSSTPLVNANKVSLYASVQGACSYERALVVSVITPKNNAITFVALFDEAAALLIGETANELAESVRDLAV